MVNTDDKNTQNIKLDHAEYREKQSSSEGGGGSFYEGGHLNRDLQDVRE